MTRSPPFIDRDKLRAHARRLEGPALLVWLDRAIDLLPDEALPALIVDYVRAEDLAPDSGSRPDLLHVIRRFHRESLARRYFQDFMVNSRNFREMSRGTETWIAEHTRLLDACMRAERSGDLDTARQGFELLIDLLRQIDRCEIDIIFFADEGGSWQVGVNWRAVLLCLSGLTTRFRPAPGTSPCRAGSWWLVSRLHATRAAPRPGTPRKHPGIGCRAVTGCGLTG